MLADAMGDLVRWEVEQAAPLPMRESQIALLETRGVVVDLREGIAFMPRDSWSDFAERWVREMVRRGVVPTEKGLGRAIWRAQGGEWSPTFCNAVAFKTLPDARRRVAEMTAEDAAQVVA